MSPTWLEAGWPAPAGVRALTTYRGGGASAAPFASLNLGDHVGDAAAAVARNRAALRAAARLPCEPAWLAQVHGVAVVDLDDNSARATGAGAPGAIADAAFTRRAGIVCAVLSADCLPVLLAAENGEVVAAAHAGWRGLAAGVIEATVHALHVPPKRLLAWLGPAISARHFEVGAEVRDAFLRDDPRAGAAFTPGRGGRFLADLSALAQRRLQALGIERIHRSNQCTYADEERYFSHRRDGNTGRLATLIWRADP